MLSVAVVARNEADRIGAALRSVAFADQLVVLDARSTDDTVAVARSHGAVVHELDWPGHVEQKNRALALCAGDWVLSLDADEELSPELAASVRAVVAEGGPPVAGRVARRNLWLGHPLAHGGWYPDRRVRLVRRGRARWGGTNPHDQLLPEDPVRDLAGDLLHRPYRDLGEHLATVDRYTAIAAAALRAEGRRGSWVDLAVRPPWHLFRALVLQQGLRDGVPGLVVGGLGALYVLLKWARVRDPAFATNRR